MYSFIYVCPLPPNVHAFKNVFVVELMDMSNSDYLFERPKVSKGETITCSSGQQSRWGKNNFVIMKLHLIFGSNNSIYVKVARCYNNGVAFRITTVQFN